MRFEHAKRPDDRGDYCLDCSFLSHWTHRVLVFTLVRARSNEPSQRTGPPSNANLFPCLMKNRWHKRVSNPGHLDPESYFLPLRHTGWANRMDIYLFISDLQGMRPGLHGWDLLEAAHGKSARAILSLIDNIDPQNRQSTRYTTVNNNISGYRINGHGIEELRLSPARTVPLFGQHLSPNQIRAGLRKVFSVGAPHPHSSRISFGVLDRKKESIVCARLQTKIDHDIHIHPPHFAIWWIALYSSAIQ